MSNEDKTVAEIYRALDNLIKIPRPKYVNKVLDSIIIDICRYKKIDGFTIGNTWTTMKTKAKNGCLALPIR